MDYDLIQHLSKSIDNVYNNVANENSRKTIAVIKNDQLVIDFRTIFNSDSRVRHGDLELQTRDLKKEAIQMINERLKTIKDCYKECSGKNLKTKKCDEYDRIEALSVSPYTPVKVYKYVLSICFEIK